MRILRVLPFFLAADSIMQKLTLTYSGTTTLTIIGTTSTEIYATSFPQTNTRGTSVASHASCPITFKPAQFGSLNGRRLRIALPARPDTGLERDSYWHLPGGEPVSSQPRLCQHGNRCSDGRTLARLDLSTGSTNSISEMPAIYSSESAY